MTFDREFFDAGLYRMGTNSVKWDVSRAEHGADLLPMWVADMDFACAPAISEAVLRRAAHPCYGYTDMNDADADALIGFWQRRHGLTFAREDILTLPCVVTGIKVAILALTEPGDGVIIQSPVYGPFRMSVEATGRTLMEAPLLRREDGRYDMDLDAVEAQLKAGAKVMVLCSPHNPVSRAWTREELTSLMTLLTRYGAVLVSDEIHADFVYAPAEFVPALSIRRDHVVMLCAASKTFNIAGLQQASCVCCDVAIREKIARVIDSCGVTSGNVLALDATRAAYNDSDAWLDGLLTYLDGNRAALADVVSALLPRAVLTPMTATYLAWLDLRAYGYAQEELLERMYAAGVMFNDGKFFGDAGDGFLRVNIGCPRANIDEAIRRLAKALA